MTQTDDYFDLYAATVFTHAPWPAQWPERFWIITAYPPTGESKPEEATFARLDAELVAALRAEGATALHRVTGGSADGTHQEPGWAVALPQEAALRVGRQFRQIAVFLVEPRGLTVVDCTTERAYPLGRAM